MASAIQLNQNHPQYTPVSHIHVYALTHTHPHIQIQRYFDALPEDKVPKIGSTGERHRDKQLAFQLPKQDLSLGYCKHVEPQHHASYEDFVAARNEIALDIGTATFGRAAQPHYT